MFHSNRTISEFNSLVVTFNRTLKSCSKVIRPVAPIALFLMIASMFSACGADGMDLAEQLETNSITESQPEKVEGNTTSEEELKETITDILIDKGHTELLEALDYVNGELYTQLVELFGEQTRPHTLFAPSNEAFFKLYSCLGMKTQDIAELDDPVFVRDILFYHVLRGAMDSNSIIPFENVNEIETFLGMALTIKKDRSIESFGSTAIIDSEDADQKAKNGIVHTISEVLLPFDLSCQQDDAP